MEHSNLNQNSTSPEASPIEKGYFTQFPQNTEGPKPIHLIYYNQEDSNYRVLTAFNIETFRVSEEAKEFLKSIKEKVGVISVAGKYRTGKSFLLNRVIINKRNQGFGVGPTINPCTKGLWIWGETLEGEYQGEKLKILLIDSEGIGAFDEDENHDTKIFLFALLLCSYFIYNSMGTIDENAINNLSLIINLSKELQIKSEVLGETDPDDIAKYFPSFLWVVRDFSLRLLDTYGNQLTPKEYLENAIQPQKGTSDQIETKNRIRRLVKHFFQDRDCYTLVRPVEEEKQLQSLQSMPDDQLRTEFVQSVNSLRQKIFKRVKPKTLNSKFITGEMLLELCYSYTEAVNTGSVPNIQNAWSYVCQNECQRAINDSINSYEQQMRKVLEQAKLEYNQDIIRKEHKVNRDIAVVTFKSKAVGQEIQEFESNLRDGISKKYKDIKNDFLRFCRSKANAFLEADVTMLKRNLQNDIYESMDKFMESLEQVKLKYNEQGPNFSSKAEVFSEISMQLIIKAADFMTITSKKETDVNLKRQKERVDELEKEKSMQKQELMADKRALEAKIQELEQDKNNSIRNEKLLEERMKYMQEEKDKTEKSLNDKWKRKLEENSDVQQSFGSKIKVLEAQLKAKEDEIFKHRSEFEKLHALIEQKLQLTENELQDYKNKYAAKDVDYKEINKELYSSRKEVQQLTNQLHRVEQDNQDQLKRVTQDYETTIQDLQLRVNQGTSGNPQVNEDQQQQWNKERQQMQIQMKMLTETMEQQKKMQESLLLALSNNKQPVAVSNDKRQSEQKYKEKNKELLITNQNLSQQIVQMQSKQMNLEKMISNLKQFKFMIHYAIAIQCKTCNKLYPKNQYSQHLPACNRENERMSTINAQQNIQPIEIMITSSSKVDNDYTYDIQVERNTQQWRLIKKLTEFRKLFEELYTQFPTYSLPFIPDEWLHNATEEFYHNELKRKLQIFLVDMARVPFIRENAIFKSFLEMDQNYVDDEIDVRRTMQSMGGIQSTTFNSLSTTFTSNGNRQSVLNPFTSSSSSMIMVNNSKTLDGRKSVSPMLNGQYTSLQKQQQENMQFRKNHGSGGSTTVGQSMFNMKEQIQELVEDEDYSSMASHNRISQMMQDDISNRPSVFSMRNQEFIKDGDYKSNSPFQQVDVTHDKIKSLQPNGLLLSASKSKERYSHVKNTFFDNGESSASQVALTGLVEEEHDFEDSFNNDVSDTSISNRKITLNDDDLFTNRHLGKQDENSPMAQPDFSKTKSNLMKKFENEGPQPLQKKLSNRYDDEARKAVDDNDDDLQRE